jgi:SAM-dependent methyltransferase
MEEARERNRAIWAAGDWDAVADVIAAVGPRVLDRLDVGPGVRLLDVGAGTGGAIAIPAAQRGAQVVASDVTDAWFDAGRARCEAAGVGDRVEWVVADAMDLPFEDHSFDVVTSTFGHMFAPDHAAAARELARVVKPGGTVAIATWTPEGFVGSFFGTIGKHAPAPPPGAESPIRWGETDRVRELLEPHDLELELVRETVTFDHDEDAESFVVLYENNFGPMVTARNAIGDDAWPAAHADLVALFEERNTKTGDTLSVEAEYLVTLGRKRPT